MARGAGPSPHPPSTKVTSGVPYPDRAGAAGKAWALKENIESSMAAAAADANLVHICVDILG